MLYQLAIIVPCYNEAQNLPLIINAFTNIVQANNKVQVILVNNGSTDNTIEIIKNINLHSNIQWLQVPVNKGYGNGIVQGLLQANAAVLSFTHADMQTNPNDVIRAFELYQHNNNDNLLVKGKRINRNKLDALFSWFMQLYTNYTLKTNLSDINAQPKVFSHSFFNKIKDNAPHDFSFDLYFLYFASKMGNIKTIDVSFLQRKFGEAKGGGSFRGKIKLIKRTLSFINQFAKKYV